MVATELSPTTPEMSPLEVRVSGPSAPFDLSTHKSYEGALFLVDLSRFDSAAKTSEAGRSLPASRGAPCGNEANSMAKKLSARNRIEGKIVELQLGGVMGHVTVQAGKNLIESVITKRSVEEMKLKVGDRVTAVIKSTEVMLEKG